VPEAPLNTPLPIYAEYTGSEELTKVVVKYQGPGMSEWKTAPLKKSDNAYVGKIPCKDMTQGDLKFYVQGFDAQTNPVASSGTKTKPYTVAVKSELDGPPPSLPGQEPPKPCAGGGGGGEEECPPGMESATCSSGKDPGEACEKDKECKSHSCQDGACAEGGKKFGEDCEKDGECASGSCQDSKCAAAGNKKGPGESCDTDDQCDSGKCKDDVCTEGGPGGGKFARIWIGLGVQLDMYLLPGAVNVCKLDTSASYTTPYTCVNPNTLDLRPFGGGQPGSNAPPSLAPNSNFPGNTGNPSNTGFGTGSFALNKLIILSGGNNDQVSGGFAIGNLRILASLDYALNQNMLTGLRAGYVLFTNPGSGAAGPAFAPAHVEARFTYLLGKSAISKGGLAPMFFGGLGVGEFDAYVPVAVTVGNKNFTPMVPGAHAGDIATYAPNAWAAAGPFFVSAGGGIRYGFSPKAAMTVGLRLELGLGGTAGSLFGIAPEAGVQFGL
jgi:hypothetical protein